MNWIGLHDCTISFSLAVDFCFQNRMCESGELNVIWYWATSTLFAQTFTERPNDAQYQECDVKGLHCNFCRSVGRVEHSFVWPPYKCKWNEKSSFFKNCSRTQVFSSSTTYNKRSMYAQAINAFLFEYAALDMDIVDQRTIGLCFCFAETYRCNHRINYILLHLCRCTVCGRAWVCSSELYKSNHTSDFIVAGLARKIKRRKSKAKEEKKNWKNNNQKKSYSAVNVIFLGERNDEKIHILPIFISSFLLMVLRVCTPNTHPMIPYRRCSTIKLSYGNKFCSLHFVQRKSNSNTYGLRYGLPAARCASARRRKKKKWGYALSVSITAKAVHTFWRNLSTFHR